MDLYREAGCDLRTAARWQPQGASKVEGSGSAQAPARRRRTPTETDGLPAETPNRTPAIRSCYTDRMFDFEEDFDAK